MNPKKILVETINELADFPGILESIETQLIEEKGEYFLILNATNYSHPVSLLNITIPDLLLLNLKLPVETAAEMTIAGLKNDRRVKVGMITSDASAYYTSLCSTFNSIYKIDTSTGLRSIPDVLGKQQLN